MDMFGEERERDDMPAKKKPSKGEAFKQEQHSIPGTGAYFKSFQDIDLSRRKLYKDKSVEKVVKQRVEREERVKKYRKESKDWEESLRKENVLQKWEKFRWLPGHSERLKREQKQAEETRRKLAHIRKRRKLFTDWKNATQRRKKKTGGLPPLFEPRMTK